jgi:hypothetical protein
MMTLFMSYQTMMTMVPNVELAAGMPMPWLLNQKKETGIA